MLGLENQSFSFTPALCVRTNLISFFFWGRKQQKTHLSTLDSSEHNLLKKNSGEVSRHIELPNPLWTSAEGKVLQN